MLAFVQKVLSVDNYTKDGSVVSSSFTKAANTF